MCVEPAWQLYRLPWQSHYRSTSEIFFFDTGKACTCHCWQSGSSSQSRWHQAVEELWRDDFLLALIAVMNLARCPSLFGGFLPQSCFCGIAKTALASLLVWVWWCLGGRDDMCGRFVTRFFRPRRVWSSRSSFCTRSVCCCFCLLTWRSRWNRLAVKWVDVVPFAFGRRGTERGIFQARKDYSEGVLDELVWKALTLSLGSFCWEGRFGSVGNLLLNGCELLNDCSKDKDSIFPAICTV